MPTFTSLHNTCMYIESIDRAVWKNNTYWVYKNGEMCTWFCKERVERWDESDLSLRGHCHNCYLSEGVVDCQIDLRFCLLLLVVFVPLSHILQPMPIAHTGNCENSDWLQVLFCPFNHKMKVSFGVGCIVESFWYQMVVVPPLFPQCICNSTFISLYIHHHLHLHTPSLVYQLLLFFPSLSPSPHLSLLLPSPLPSLSPSLTHISSSSIPNVNYFNQYWLT